MYNKMNSFIFYAEVQPVFVFVIEPKKRGNRFPGPLSKGFEFFETYLLKYRFSMPSRALP